MPSFSAGLLLYKRQPGELQVLLVHPGGPFFRNKDAGAWSIPKGLIEDGEDSLAAARREFAEETGLLVTGAAMSLSPIKQKGGKTVQAWAVEGEFDLAQLTSNTFELEWPPKSGKRATFPEVDRAAWFTVAEAREKINAAQVTFVEELVSKLAAADS